MEAFMSFRCGEFPIRFLTRWLKLVDGRGMFVIGRGWNLLLALCSFSLTVAAVAQPRPTEYPIPTPKSEPGGIALGSDGAVWFTETRGNKIGRLDGDGFMTEFPLPRENSRPNRIKAGPDGALWFTMFDTAKIGRITVSGQINEIAQPVPEPFAITPGPDGALWIMGYQTIGRLTMDGNFTSFAVPQVGREGGMTSGPDGAVWFFVPGMVGRINSSGLVTKFLIPNLGVGNYDFNSPNGITAAPDGALWFTENYNISRITTNGELTRYFLRDLDIPLEIVAGQDGALWFTEVGGPRRNNIGRITLDGRLITQFSLDDGDVQAIAAGPDGSLWATQADSNNIVRVELQVPPRSPTCTQDETTLCLNGGRFKAQAQWMSPDGIRAAAQAVRVTGETGYFTFSDPDSAEVFLKVVDGCGVNDRTWVFAGGLTNLGVVLTITDTATGVVRSYSNPPNTPFAPLQDIAAFLTCANPPVGASRPYRRTDSSQLIATPSARDDPGPCVADATTLCLEHDRFQVRAEWSTPEGATSPANTIPLTSETGGFWFFTPGNLELAVKVLDGCGVNSRHWTFAAGLTNVGVVLTVTDTLTGLTRVYTSPPGTPFAPIQDTDGPGSCP